MMSGLSGLVLLLTGTGWAAGGGEPYVDDVVTNQAHVETPVEPERIAWSLRVAGVPFARFVLVDLIVDGETGPAQVRRGAVHVPGLRALLRADERSDCETDADRALGRSLLDGKTVRLAPAPPGDDDDEVFPRAVRAGLEVDGVDYVSAVAGGFERNRAERCGERPIER